MSQIIRFLSERKGQSLIEVLVALGIFALSLSASFQLFFGGQKVSEDNINFQQAMDFGQEGMTAVRAVRDRNWAELTAGDHGLVFQNNEWMFGSSSTSDSQDLFTRTVSIYQDDENTRTATTTVTWISGGRTQSVESVEKLTNWESPLQSSCKTEPLSGDWTRPVTLGTADIGSGNSGTDILVHYPYVFMSGSAASSDKPDIFVFDVTDPVHPSLIKSLDIGSGGINSIYIKGDYLYAASPNDAKELMIFNNVTNPTSMTLAGSYNLSGSGDAYTVAAFGDTVVAVGRDSVASNEIAFLNVSNPASPSIISEVSTGGDVRDSAVSDNVLYFVSKESDADIYIYNISVPLSPSLITTHDIAGTTEDLSIFLHYKGGKRNLMVGNEESEIVMIGATTTTQMYVRDRLNVNGEVNDIVCAV
ncbi:MAG: prepilin-type N-terminal cleavage/methylation domain-containing protein [bacterium]|nr:prepilin-type N-terminal cleavage/methylation domain-containing protein [bacterium]